MNQEEKFVKLKSIITPYLDEEVNISMDSDIFMDLSINSIDFLNIIIDVEEKFGCLLTEKMIVSINTVKDLLKYIPDIKK